MPARHGLSCILPIASSTFFRRLSQKNNRCFTRQGSISLMMALILSALLLVFSLFLQAGLYRSAQADLTRAMSAQIQTGLAAYDLNLLSDFGLWGYRLDRIDPLVFQHSLPGHMKRHPMILLPGNPLTDETVLETQILSYMKARLPVIYVDHLFSQLDSLSTGSQAVSQEHTIHHVSGWLAGFSGNSARSAASSLTNGLFSQVEEVAAVQLDQIYRENAAALTGIHQDQELSSLLTMMPDFFDPASLAIAADEFDQFLNFSTPLLYEKACVAEYVLGQFSCAVLTEKKGGYTQPVRTINGRQMLGFPDDRILEVEQMITGVNNPRLAAKIVQGVLVSLRTVIHLADLITDKSQMQIIRGTAAAISTALAAITAGSVIIEPETVAWLLAVARSLKNGWSDVNSLLNGNAVSFWPGDQAALVNLYYADYLRLFLLALPRPLLLNQIGRQLETIIPGPFFTAIEIRTNWRSQELVLKGQYP